MPFFKYPPHDRSQITMVRRNTSKPMLRHPPKKQEEKHVFGNKKFSRPVFRGGAK